MNLFEHARAMYRRRHMLRRRSALSGLRSLESMCERTLPRRRLSPNHLRWGSLGRSRRSLRAPASFSKNRTRR
jgi:hypothetical protein